MIVRDKVRKVLLSVIPLLLSVANVTFSQSLQEKLAKKADFVPDTTVAKEALVQIAIHYRIPMGIEWMYDIRESEPITLTPQQSVEDLINQILVQRPGYFKEINLGVVNVKKATIASDSRNFLNLRLAEYSVRDINVFGAESQLRVGIHRMRHPEPYARGVNGGYGQPDRGDGFNVSNISCRRENVTVREILDVIVAKNGNSLWIVEINPGTMMQNEPFFAQRAFDRDVQSEFTWRILPFRTNQ